MTSYRLRLSAYSNLFSSSIFLILLITIVVALSLNIDALGQTLSSSSTTATTTTQQTWIDKLNNLKMQFGYLPKEPVIDKPTELKFTVQNLQTGEQLNDNISARVAVINNAGGQQRSFKFTNITAPNGIYSVKYLFPDSGQYNVITKIDSNDFTSLASFNVSVPFAPLGTVNVGNLNPIALPVIGGIIAAIVGTVALIWMNRKKSI
jgi:hypothetical protein